MESLPVTELPALDDDRSRTLAGAGKRLLVVYKKSCPTCRLALSVIEPVYRKGEGKLDFLLVSQDDAEDTYAGLRELDLTMPVVMDRPTYELSAKLGPQSVPMLVSLDGDRVASVSEGFDKAELAALLDGFVRAAGLRFDAAFAVADASIPAFKPG